MTAPSTINPPSFRKRRRPWLRLVRHFLALLLVVALIALGFYLAWRYRANQSLQEAIAETDALGAPWRLADLEGQRTAVPDEKNAALKVLAIGKLLPKDGLANPALEGLDEIAPQVQLSEKQTDDL